ncbi:IclR family transcriptional regulator C-terminal domain-containing protein [soil metagenome]
MPIMSASPKEETVDPRARYQVPNLDRALSILELLGASGRPLTLSEIAEALGFPTNSVFRISMTLESRGYVERDGVTKRYSLSRKLLKLASQGSGDDNLYEKSLDVMRRLRDATKETALLGVLLACDAEGVVLDHVPSVHPFRFAVDPGTRFVLHTAAPGKAMLAALPQDEREDVVGRIKFTRYTRETITSASAFLEHLEEVGERGYGFDLAEEREGQYCVGSAILNAAGYPIASLWITAPSSRLPDGQLDAVGRLVKEHADEISARYGYLSR